MDSNAFTMTTTIADGDYPGVRCLNNPVTNSSTFNAVDLRSQYSELPPES